MWYQHKLLLFMYIGSLYSIYILAEGSVEFICQKGFIVTHVASKRKKIIHESCVRLDTSADNLTINDKLVSPGEVVIEPMDNEYFVWDKKTYSGKILIKPVVRGYEIAVVEDNISGSTNNDYVNADNVTEETISYCIIKVLLDTVNVTASTNMVIRSKQGFLVTAKKHGFIENTLVLDQIPITVNTEGWKVNNELYKGDVLYIKPINDSGLQYQDYTYAGIIELKKEGNTVLVINHVELEDYVASVLRTESWPGWPLEVNKVFAITSRSYVMAMVLRAHKNKKPYHVRNTNHHQTYTGHHDDELLKKAVKDTAGIFLAYKNLPVLAMFDACCGGVVPAHIADFDFSMVPYLQRVYACNHCKKSKVYAWQVEIEISLFEAKIVDHMKSLKRVKDVKVVKKDRAGLVNQVAIKGHKKSIYLSYNMIKSFLKGIKSRCFLITKKPGVIVLNGRGIGHHLGLCQWGACQMVKDGWYYARILQFYYPGTELKYIRY